MKKQEEFYGLTENQWVTVNALIDSNITGHAAARAKMVRRERVDVCSYGVVESLLDNSRPSYGMEAHFILGLRNLPTTPFSEMRLLLP